MRALAVIVLFGVAFATATRAAAEQYKVIVHPKNPVTELKGDFVRNVYLKKAKAWGDGSTARPIDLPTKQTVRERFTKAVLRKTPSQLKNYWNQQIFSGKGTPPPEGRSVAAVVAYVIEHPGAVAYLPADAETGRAKVVEVR